MKTLDQWLEDSDEEDDEEDVKHDSSQSDAHNGSEDRRSSTSRPVSGPRTSGAPSLAGSQVSAHTPTTIRPAELSAGGPYARQEQTREKMRRLLGADAVVKATTPTSSNANDSSHAWPISVLPDRTHFPFGATPTSTQPAEQGMWTPPTLGSTSAFTTPATGRPSPNSFLALARADTATDSSQLPEVERTMKGFDGGGGSAGTGPAYEAVAVMVVDRGTQTVTSEGTQTEPVPISVGPFYTGPCLPPAYGGQGWMGNPYRNYIMSPPPPFGRGVDSRPYHQQLDDYEKKETEEASRLREELGMIQNSIDMLIARYNLPPPPL
ncbi:hypothetical protein ABB37_02886 [Leptomonas pyrrhocoris]|uniref:Uncharacterized protein n=1 Tax=Leptomonas pyrrhocoris TaxID=157538 RepID=A0A0N0DXU1_LEPPY|nr:hypothetical protein ABB37_02886 [Leptomonas pyrrhocoris]KPA83202.1 hypothetical protein ABB37_02886 [Leptomonas pyrrhocoris]|eukprot:XP_015661641.1 hypothetical protein ABB37_02886 [Leptomonas pyrrhocoris]